MEKAGAAMKQIHRNLNIDIVDETMYAAYCIFLCIYIQN
jgi:hypothetical protein